MEPWAIGLIVTIGIIQTNILLNDGALQYGQKIEHANTIVVNVLKHTINIVIAGPNGPSCNFTVESIALWI